MDTGAAARRPWLLVVAALVMASLLAYVLFGAYIPTRQRMAGLEAEIKEVYQKEAQLQTQLARSLQKNTLLQQQLTALAAEREGLVRHAQALAQGLAAVKRRPPEPVL